MAMQPPQPPPNGGGGGLAGDMARLGYLARWHCDRCGLGFEDFDACEAHEAGCDGAGAGAGAGADAQDQQQQRQQVEQGPPAPVVIPQDEDGHRPAAAAVAVVPQRAPQRLPGQPLAPTIIPIHNDGDTSAGGSVAAAAAGQAEAAAPVAVAQPARAAREAEQEAIDLTIDDSNSDSDSSSDDGDDDGDDDDVVVVDDAGTGQSRRAHAQNVSANQQAGAPPAVAAAAVALPPKRGVVTVWTCDICGVAEFNTFDAAAAHEEACAAKKEREDAEAAAAAAVTRKAQQQRVAATASATVTVAAQNRDSSVQQHPSHRQNQQQAPIALVMAALPPPLHPNRPLHQEGTRPQPQPKPQPQPQKPQQQAKAPGSGISNSQQKQQHHDSNSNINPVFRQQDTKYWSCDICNASFQSYDAACKHERNCEGNPNAPVKSITTFRGADGRPISDEASQLTEPVILDDDQEPQPPAPPAAPYWTCDHCQVARFDTYDQASAHERICRAVAKQLGQNDAGTAATTNNSITAAAPKPTPPPPVAPNLERILAAKPVQQKIPPQDSSRKIQIPSGTTFPLMHEQFTKDKTLTVPPHVALALDQLVLTMKDADTGEGTPLARSSALIELDLCCRHCKEHFPVTSTNRLGFDVERVITGHFMGKAVCKSMPVDVPELMEKLQNTVHVHGTDEETKASIRTYSQYVVEQYSLINLTDLKAKKCIGMLSFKDNLSPSLELARSASDAAVKARMRALRDGLSSEKGISGGVKPRKRPSNADVENEERLGSSPADITKMAAKRRRISKATSDGGDDSNTAKLVCMVDEDLDGHEYYVPPSGGVPLVSTQSSSMFAQLSLYYQIVISNVELCHGINGEQGQKSALELRCHNCKSNPEFNTFISLSNFSRQNWHKAVKQLAKHVEDCPCLASRTLKDIKSSRRNKKEKTLAAYCEFLSSLYCIKDSTLGLVWEKAKPISYQYDSKPKDASDKSKNIPPGQLPRHNLMLPPGSAPKKIIVPDYYFFLASQYNFTLMKRETSPSNKRIGSINPEPDMTLAICCRHCLCTRPLESIRDGCSSSRYLLESHFVSCPATGRLAAGYLDDLRKSKATQEKQCSTSIITCMKNTMAKTYGMVDLEWNGTCSGVGFSTGLRSAMRLLSKKHSNVSSWETFQLPLLPPDSVRPVTEGLRLQVDAGGKTL